MTTARKEKPCGACRAPFVPHRMGQKGCSPECEHGLARAAKAKKEQREAAKDIKRRKEAIKTRSQWAKEAQQAVNAYVRLRDADKPCISCGRFHQGQNHAGHYRSVGSAPHLRYDADRNIWLQCAPCNTYLHGNLVAYRAGLIARIGLAAVEALEADQQARHYSIDDLKAIKAEYAAKRRALEKERAE